jgi:autotransporter-associated beta strand protein
MNVNGGLVDSPQIQLGQNAGTSTLNLNGGVVAVGGLFNTGATSVLNLNGGTLRAKSTNANFIGLTGSTSTVNVLAGGAIIDTNSFNSTIQVPLLSGTTNDGGLTKQGAGTLTLSATNAFTGATSISTGTLAFDRIAALATTSGISIGSGAGLTYTGTAGVLNRNLTVSSGTGTVRNTGSGVLTLSGTLTKNGSVLWLNTGTFTVSGLITGANANSDLVVDAATVTLTNSNNDYNGPTFVRNGGTLILGANNVISSLSAVTVDASTLTVGGFTDTIQSLTTAGNSTINVTASGGSSGGLSMGNLTLGAGTDTLGLTMTSPTAGRYALFTYAGSRSGTFDTVTGLNSNYNVVYGAASNSSIDLQMKATLGTVSATTANARIIVGGSTAITYTVANTSPTDAATLFFQSGSNSLTVTGSSSGSALANQTSTAVSGLTFTSATVGLGQTGSFTVTDPNAITTSGNGSVSVDVLNHSLASFASSDTASQTLTFGTYDPTTGGWSGGDGGSGTIGYSLFNIASSGFTNAQTAGLDLYDWSFTGDAIFAPGLSQFQNLVSGSSNAFAASIASPGSLAEGNYTATYTLRFRDQNLPGATDTRDLTLTMNVIVVPEPAAWLAGMIGAALTALHLRRRRRSLPGDDRT